MPRKGTLRRILDAYVVPRYGTVKHGLSVPAGTDLIVGQGATIRGGVASQGRVFLAKAVVVGGPIESRGDVVIGANCRIEGNVRSETFILVQDGATILGALESKGGIRILGGRVTGTVSAGGDIEVRGNAQTLDLKAGGRIRSLPAPTD